ncbi:opioid growth factor receptor-like protein 1 [Denticeps clupeoides]|uniref:Opioid growth factor receptor (OGFr) conserved domain-containing protein n=1 Tax=Denticeps clupeoides TaxID=299321 RepID=A0AAY4EAH6_9TELE|nr:opioid growth factor receptor-like protein 1 [Denticeps clupeoides]
MDDGGGSASEKRRGDAGDSDRQYDSTWDDEEDSGETQSSDWRSERPSKIHKRRNMYAARDMQIYRHDYPGQFSDEEETLENYNLKFYRNQIHSSPDCVYIDEFHEKWERDYDKLERVHSYIQWLFPIQEYGMNYLSHKLTKNEIQGFKAEKEVKDRLLKSYKLMLDFYGIQLVDEKSGAVERAANWEERFDNLNRRMHNNLRITRILKCLGTLGLEHYQAPLVRFFLEETLTKATLPNVKTSVLDYFMFSVRNKEERKELIEFAFMNFEPKEDFVWCPRHVQKKLLRKHNSGGEKVEDSNQENEKMEKEINGSKTMSLGKGENEKCTRRNDENDDDVTTCQEAFTGNKEHSTQQQRKNENSNGEEQEYQDVTTVKDPGPLSVMSEYQAASVDLNVELNDHRDEVHSVSQSSSESNTRENQTASSDVLVLENTDQTHQETGEEETDQNNSETAEKTDEQHGSNDGEIQNEVLNRGPEAENVKSAERGLQENDTNDKL